MSGLARRKAWRWAVAVWLVAVVVGGGLTLWLQDSAEPPPAARWEQSSPTQSPPEGWQSQCPTLTPDADGHAAVLCFIRTR
ncbi:hypothetical protein ACIRVK_01555 [Streptomyces sp. NPDC101152]|uniref:hypothetical protein n=1 Tax=Streptomyces sp. NPDC101152 TaxID=3366116 RepID=UPI0038131E4D